MEKESKEGIEVALYYLKNFSEVVREPFLVLDPDLKVVGGNKIFYENFHVTKEGVEGKLFYEMGNGQWNIPELKKLLEDILPKEKTFIDFEVSHDFPVIGHRIMLLNAKQLDSTKHILLAFEDITVKREIEKKIADYTRNLEKAVAQKTEDLSIRIDELSKLNKIMIGRELKMVELKDEITQLKEKKTV